MGGGSGHRWNSGPQRAPSDPEPDMAAPCLRAKLAALAVPTASEKEEDMKGKGKKVDGTPADEDEGDTRRPRRMPGSNRGPECPRSMPFVER